MKRSRNVKLAQMKKSWLPATPSITVAAIVFVSGCSEGAQEMNIYSGVSECIKNNPEQSEQCKTAYQDALNEAESTAPKYKSRADCVAEFGEQMCVQSSQNNWFMPAMAGFMFGQMMNNRSYNHQPIFTSTNPHSRHYGGWSSSDGYSYGKVGKSSKVYVPSDQFKKKPAVTKTISRGGFGSKAAAKSSWSRSSSKSWGG